MRFKHVKNEIASDESGCSGNEDFHIVRTPLNLQKTFNILYLIIPIFSIDTAYTALYMLYLPHHSKKRLNIMKKKHIPILLIALALIAVMGAWIVANHNNSEPETEIVAEEVEFLSTRNADEQTKSSSDEVSKLQPIDDDGLPF
jgi:hypothetical protein